MDIVSAIWFSSAVGAVLFFAGGLLASRALSRPRPQPLPSLATSPPLADEGTARRLAEEGAARLAHHNHELSRRLAEEISQGALVRQQRDDLGAELRGKLAQLEPIAQGAAAQRREVERLTERLAASEAQVRAAAAERGEVERLTGRVAAAEAQARAAAAERREVESLTGRLAAAEAQARTANEARARAASASQREVERLVERLAGADAQANAARSQAAAAQARQEELGKELASARAGLERAERDAAAGKREVARLTERLAAVEAQAKEAHAQRTLAQVRTEEASRLREDNGVLRGRLEDLERARAGGEDLTELQRRGAELSMKARVLDQRRSEMEQQKAEIDALRDALAALELRARGADELRRRVRELEARGFADRSAAPAPEPVSRPTDQRLETALEGSLDALIREEAGARSAILADSRGLLIAASGDLGHEHEAAAAASLMTYVAERLGELLPLAAPSSLELVDDNRVVLRTRWLRTRDECFLLTTLGLTTAASAESRRAESRCASISQLIAS